MGCLDVIMSVKGHCALKFGTAEIIKKQMKSRGKDKRRETSPDYSNSNYAFRQIKFGL